MSHDYIVAYMIAHKIPLTVANYLQLSYLGEKKTLADLEGEQLVEVEELIDEGVLVDSESQGVI